MARTRSGSSAQVSARARRRRRGAIGVAFAIAVPAVLGMGALATDAGVWLMTRRNAQNAADAAAYAAVTSLVLRNSTEATSAARQVAARNGFTDNGALSAVYDTRVITTVGRWSGNTFTSPAPTGSSPNAVKVDIWQVQRMGLSQLISSAAPIAWGGAIATIEAGGPACTLSIPPPSPTSQVSGRTNIAGSTTVNAPNCIIASNSTERKSINIQGSASGNITVGALRASGQCYNCEDVPAASVQGGYISGAPLTPNPFTGVDQAAMPSFSGSTCVAPTYRNAAGQTVNANQATQISLTSYNTRRTYANSRSTPTATCTNISVGSGQTLTFTPGTYYFSGADLSMSASSARIVCSGCTPGGEGVTLVFTGSNANNVGSIQITGGEFTLIAPGPNNASPDPYQGVVIYRDDLGRTSNATGDMVKITGNPQSTLFGAIYVPTGGVEMLGTSGMNQTTAGNCVAVVAGEITYSGNSAVAIDACLANGTTAPQAYYVVLVQ